MFYLEISIFLYILQISLCDWVSEWMNPVRDLLKESSIRKNNENFHDMTFGQFETNDKYRIAHVSEATAGPEVNNLYYKNIGSSIRKNNENFHDMTLGQFETTENYRIAHVSEATAGPEVNNLYHEKIGTPTTIKMKLENTLRSAKLLAESLKMQINEVSTRERNLKDAIVNGRSGVSAVTVKSVERPLSMYLVQDGFWTQCIGELQLPPKTQSSNLFNELFTTPRCIGKEITSQQDPCAFNSVIKYETVPTIRHLEYSEDEFLCLKKSFNSTLERYLSVPRQIINDTCINGVVRSLQDNQAKCGVRVISEYTYYPSRTNALSSLPLEYCSETDSSCKLIVAWHVSNTSIENFEFLKDEQGFKKFFMKTGSYNEHII